MLIFSKNFDFVNLIAWSILIIVFLLSVALLWKNLSDERKEFLLENAEFTTKIAQKEFVERVFTDANECSDTPLSLINITTENYIKESPLELL